MVDLGIMRPVTESHKCASLGLEWTDVKILQIPHQVLPETKCRSSVPTEMRGLHRVTASSRMKSQLIEGGPVGEQECTRK